VLYIDNSNSYSRVIIYIEIVKLGHSYKIVSTCGQFESRKTNVVYLIRSPFREVQSVLLYWNKNITSVPVFYHRIKYYLF